MNAVSAITIAAVLKVSTPPASGSAGSPAHAPEQGMRQGEIK